MIGILQLDTDFPRLSGDIGNPASFAVPITYSRVQDATVDAIVNDQPINQQIARRFISAARDLEQQGASVIGTSCGFLGALQGQISESIDVPFIASSLSLLPLLRTLFGADTPIAVLTFDANKLTPAHFGGAYDPAISIHGLDPGSHWYRVIKENRTTVDEALAGRDVMKLADRAVRDSPALLLIECTNLSPWKQDIRARHNVPVFDLVDALHWLHDSMAR